MDDFMRDLRELARKAARQKDGAGSGKQELYAALLALTKRRISELPQNQGKKRLYYVSAEFLLGKLLSNNLINLGLYDEVDAILRENGMTLAELEEAEPEPSLGNGGLGRLAACFLDSIATLGLNGVGVGLNYHFGLFRQKFAQLKQTSMPDEWLETESWLEQTKRRYTVAFKDFTVQSVLYYIPVVGYGGKTTRLYLFDVDTVDERIVTQGIDFDKTAIAKNLTLFLYPDDSDENGRLLRVYQQYFMVAGAAQLLLEEAELRGSNLRDLDEYAVVQINDTHPSMIIPELIRLLAGRGLSMDEAIAVVSKVCAYTNHTIMAEALEKWPVRFIEAVAPQLMPVIAELDRRVKARFDDAVAIIKPNVYDEAELLVHMAHMDIHYGFSINGVAALHTRILKENELKAFYAIYPEKFNNKTNGVTFRRWLLSCNQPLAKYIETLIGQDFKRDALELKKLLAYREDTAALDRLLEIKRDNKLRLKSFVKQNIGVELDENAIFDIQIKRLHLYKRQQMNALYIIRKYLAIQSGEKPRRPIALIFGAKAAPSYVAAQDVIHLLLCLQQLVNGDPDVSPYLKVAVVENYNVSAAELLIPACDISEQISLASKEASGTGNMKFMLSGAVTLGTLDGANVEIAERVGADNIYIFGASSDEVIEKTESGAYRAKDIYCADDELAKLVDFIISPELLAIGDCRSLARLHLNFVREDSFMSLLDAPAYFAAKEQAIADYEDRRGWARKMLVNIAQAGYFSSDRTIAAYDADIWRLPDRK